MRVVAVALFVAGLGLVVTAAGLIIRPYGGLPSSFVATLVAVGALCWDRQRIGEHRADQPTNLRYPTGDP